MHFYLLYYINLKHGNIIYNKNYEINYNMAGFSDEFINELFVDYVDVNSSEYKEVLTAYAPDYLQSVGVIPKGFNRMITFEGLLYGIGSVAISVPLSVAASYDNNPTIN